MTTTKTISLTTMLLLSVACVAGPDDELTKDDARARGGKADDGIDLCEWAGWYGDGVCDEFCPSPDPDCRSWCLGSSECGEGEYCTTDDGACESDCTPDTVCLPVCMGECVPEPEPEGRFCGGFAGFVCGADEYCDYEEDARCGIADHAGTCKTRPDVCSLELSPVCGCDGITYDNQCFAALAGVGIGRAGPC